MLEILTAVFGIVIPGVCVALSYMMEDRPHPMKVKKEKKTNGEPGFHLRIM